MTDYTITTNFGAKDSLPSGNAGKVIKGSEFTTEFTNIQTAVNTKADTAGDTFTGAVNFSADVAVNTNTLFVDVSEDKVGIGTTSPEARLEVDGAKNDNLLILEGAADNFEFHVTSGDAATANTSLYRLALERNGTDNGFIDFYRGGDGTDGYLTFGSSGTERMRINSLGNVGIGTSNPQRELEVTGTGNVYARITAPTDDDSAVLELKNTQETWQIRNQDTNNDALEFIDDTATRLTIKKDGNVGIGTDSPDSILDVVGADPILTIRDTSTSGADSHATLRLAESDGSGNVNVRYDVALDEGHLTFDYSNGSTISERLRIDASGNVLVGKTSDAFEVEGMSLRGSPTGSASVATFTRDGQNVAAFNRLTNDGSVLSFYKNGTTVGSISVTSSATAYNTSSDERLKENIADSTDAGSKVDAIQIRQFDWKADGLHQDYGVIAQELINVAPEAVSEGDTEEDMMGVDYSKLVPMLVKEIQSLRSRVAELENV